MNPSFARGLVLAAALLGAVAPEAAAQDVRSGSARTVVPAAFPRWDAGGSLGLLVISTSDTGNSWNGWDQKADYRFDLGRYWTTHLKTEVAVSTSNPWRDYDVRPVAPGVPAPYFYDASTATCTPWPRRSPGSFARTPSCTRLSAAA